MCHYTDKAHALTQPVHPSFHIFASGGLAGVSDGLARDYVMLLTHLKLFFISLSFAITLTGSVSPVAFWIAGSCIAVSPSLVGDAHCVVW